MAEELEFKLTARVDGIRSFVIDVVKEFDVRLQELENEVSDPTKGLRSLQREMGSLNESISKLETGMDRSVGKRKAEEVEDSEDESSAGAMGMSQLTSTPRKKSIVPETFDDVEYEIFRDSLLKHHSPKEVTKNLTIVQAAFVNKYINENVEQDSKLYKSGAIEQLIFEGVGQGMLAKRIQIASLQI